MWLTLTLNKTPKCQQNAYAWWSLYLDLVLMKTDWNLSTDGNFGLSAHDTSWCHLQCLKPPQICALFITKWIILKYFITTFFSCRFLKRFCMFYAGLWTASILWMSQIRSSLLLFFVKTALGVYFTWRWIAICAVILMQTACSGQNM